MSATLSRPNRRFRRGMAPLEFVLGIPFLLLLFTFIFSLGFAFLNKTTVSIEVRHAVWKTRDDPANWGDDALSVWTAIDPNSGAVEDERTKSARVANWLGGSLTVRSKAAVLTGTWDSRQVDVFEKEEPHLGVLEKMLGGSGAISQSIVTMIHQLLKLGALPGQDEIDAANEEKKTAEEERDKQIKEMEEQIEKLKEELEKLKEERRELQDQYDDLKDQRDDLKEQQDDLIAQADEFPLGSEERQELLDQAEALNDDIDALEGKMEDKQREIDAKNKEIDAKNKEIDTFEEQQAVAEAEIGKL